MVRIHRCIRKNVCWSMSFPNHFLSSWLFANHSTVLLPFLPTYEIVVYKIKIWQILILLIFKKLKIRQWIQIWLILVFYRSMLAARSKASWGKTGKGTWVEPSRSEAAESCRCIGLWRARRLGKLFFLIWSGFIPADKHRSIRHFWQHLRFLIP